MYAISVGSALWEFALAAYARPGVAPLCLALQDRHDANVMVMLHLCHAAAAGQAGVDVAEAASAMAPLERHLIAPLRRARRSLAAAGAVLCEEGMQQSAKRLLQAELAAERLQCLRVPGSDGLALDETQARPLAFALLESYFVSLPGKGWQGNAAASLAAAVFPG